MHIRYAQDPSTYRAGVCNIGPEEIARRRRAGLTFVGTAIVIAIVLSALALWADRGSALLLDLAAMGARLLCL